MLAVPLLFPIFVAVVLVLSIEIPPRFKLFVFKFIPGAVPVKALVKVATFEFEEAVP